MTQPRRVLPGETVLAQRRCSERRFFLRPDPLTTQIFLYVLALAQQRFGIAIHEFVAMSNHYHLVFTDVCGNRPRFFQLLDSLIARATNAAYGRWEAFWAPGSYCAPTLLEPEDMLAKCVYTLNNPVLSALVGRPDRWKGATSWDLEYGVPIKVKRPKVFFSEHMPEELELVITRPPGLFPDVDDRAARARVRDAAWQSAVEFERSHRQQGGSFMGMARVLRQPRNSSPDTRAPRRGLKPNIAGRSKWARIEALQRLKSFVTHYAEALARFLAGDTDAEFPAGTYLMRVRFGARCVSN